MIFYKGTMVNHMFSPPFGKICFTFSKHLKQFQVQLIPWRQLAKPTGLQAQLDDPTSPAAESLKKLQVESDEENLLGHRHWAIKNCETLQGGPLPVISRVITPMMAL